MLFLSQSQHLSGTTQHKMLYLSFFFPRIQIRINFIAKFVHTNSGQELCCVFAFLFPQSNSCREGGAGGETFFSARCFASCRSRTSPPTEFGERLERGVLTTASGECAAWRSKPRSKQRHRHLFFLVGQIKGPWHSRNSYRRTKALVLPRGKPRL